MESPGFSENITEIMKKEVEARRLMKIYPEESLILRLKVARADEEIGEFRFAGNNYSRAQATTHFLDGHKLSMMTLQLSLRAATCYREDYLAFPDHLSEGFESGKNTAFSLVRAAESALYIGKKENARGYANGALTELKNANLRSDDLPEWARRIIQKSI